MFREIIGIIITALLPINQEFTVLDAIADPVKAHVNGFGSPLLDGGIGNACSTCIDRNEMGLETGLEYARHLKNTDRCTVFVCHTEQEEP